ncbi:MAG: hypothetical protein PHI12_09005 [Dehalococcoidales bacterium]|nr:hypothetical protein [Dehalococcoidales bacterium]
MNPRTMTAIIDSKRYNTETATLISGNDYWDGHNYERHGRNTFLYRTAKGAYFAVHQTCWQGENDSIEPLSEDEAVKLYESHDRGGDCRLSFEDAFPGIQIEEA